MNTTPAQIYSTVPVIGTDNIRESLDYYTKVLGFLPDFEFGDPIVYAGVKSGEAEIYFSYDPGISKTIREKNISPEIFIWLSDADELYRKHVANGAEIIESVSDRPWGARQYVIREINGYRLKFAQPL
jgi:uncharacterized glyoxalase superfamily protein PhnB